MGRKRILGKTTDYITGREIKDTDDERIRQKIARYLVEEKGYDKNDIEVKRKIEAPVEAGKHVSMVDFVVRVNNRSCIVIKYGPGSIVTRERAALAVARIMEDYQVPFTVVTNGTDAAVMKTSSGEVTGTGLETIPDKRALLEKFDDTVFARIDSRQLEAERRILSAYDYLEHSLECDDDWCETG